MVGEAVFTLPQIFVTSDSFSILISRFYGVTCLLRSCVYNDCVWTVSYYFLSTSIIFQVQVII